MLTEDNVAKFKELKEANDDLKEAAAISSDQVQEFLKGLGDDFTDEVIGTIMNVAKPDGDGNVNVDEFLEAASQAD